VNNDDTTAGAVDGPGGTSPGPSPVRPEPNANPAAASSRSDDTSSPPAAVSLPSDDTSSPPAVATPSPADAALPPELAAAARTLFGDRLDLAAAYAELLATDGVVRGLIGPREAPRIWDRHMLNCAAVAERIPQGATVLDARVVDDGNLISAGGITSGLEACLWLVERFFGAQLAHRVETVLDYERRGTVWRR